MPVAGIFGLRPLAAPSCEAHCRSGNSPSLERALAFSENSSPNNVKSAQLYDRAKRGSLACIKATIINKINRPEVALQLAEAMHDRVAFGGGLPPGRRARFLVAGLRPSTVRPGLCTDGADPNSVDETVKTVTDSDRLPLAMKAAGGGVIVLTPARR